MWTHVAEGDPLDCLAVVAVPLGHLALARREVRAEEAEGGGGQGEADGHRALVAGCPAQPRLDLVHPHLGDEGGVAAAHEHVQTHPHQLAVGHQAVLRTALVQGRQQLPAPLKILNISLKILRPVPHLASVLPAGADDVLGVEVDHLLEAHCVEVHRLLSLVVDHHQLLLVEQQPVVQRDILVSQSHYYCHVIIIISIINMTTL